MICGSCGMRMDGRAVLACKERMKPIVDRGHVPVISAMGNMPVLKDLVVDMGPFWSKVRHMKPWLETGYEEVPEREFRVSPEEMAPIQKEALCIMCGCCVSECNSMESDPEFFGPAALAKGFRFVGDPRDQTEVERLERYNDEHGIWDCTRCYFCNERCPKGVDPRDAIAKLGAESIRRRHRPRHGREAREVVRPLGEDDGLAPRDGARARRPRASSRRSRRRSSRSISSSTGKVPLPSRPRGRGRAGGARALRGREGAGARRRGRHRPGRARARAARARRRDPAGGGGMRVAYYKGCLASLSAKELDTSTQALAPKLGIELEELEVGHLLRRGRHPRGRARLLPAPERAHPRLRRGDGLRHADDDLQRLHAQPAPGELSSSRTTTPCACA